MEGEIPKRHLLYGWAWPHKTSPVCARMNCLYRNQLIVVKRVETKKLSGPCMSLRFCQFPAPLIFWPDFFFCLRQLLTTSDREVRTDNTCPGHMSQNTFSVPYQLKAIHTFHPIQFNGLIEMFINFQTIVRLKCF